MGGRNLQLGQLDPVEGQGHLAQGVVALGPDTRQDLAYGVPQTRLVGRPPLEEELGLLWSQPAHGAFDGDSHGIRRSMRVTRIPSAPTSLSRAMVW